MAIEEVASFGELSALSGSTADAYAELSKTWQAKLDERVRGELVRAERSAKQDQQFRRSAMVGIGVVLVVAFVIYCIVGGIRGTYEAWGRLDASMQKRGYFSLKSRTASAPLVNAPAGVTLETLELQDNPLDYTVRYVLNLPVLPDNQRYSVAHELVEQHGVQDTGLFYTKPGEYGLQRFEKRFSSGYQPDWIGFTVKVVGR
ncbi:MAG: hypothetical protein JSS66_07985 [Armatimonadetes bacterium]|nr:hypothetical protein [Armatimonadota bacterium]